MMTWQETLGELFEASVNEQTLEQAAAQMVFVSEDNPEYHDLYLAAIDGGLKAASSGDHTVVGIINRSGYQVGGLEAAFELLTEFRNIYLRTFRQATESKEC